MPKLDDFDVTTISSVKITPGNKCGFCADSKCCTYITQPIDTPRKKTDFEYLLWLVSHEHVKIYKEKGGWFLLVETLCSHLLPNGDCAIYEHRPAICRDHSNDYCEFDASAEDGFIFYFEDYHSLLEYCKKRFKKWSRV